MNILRVRRGQLRAILRIEKSSFGSGAWDRAVFLDYLARPDNSLFLAATIDHAVAGYVLAVYGGVGTTRAEIDSIAVAPSKRGRGVGIALLKRAIRLIEKRGVTTVSLSVRIGNEAAIRLYRTLGFQRVRRINQYYEDGAPAWRMRKSG